MAGQTDVLAQFGAKEVEWVPRAGGGREAQPSPYAPLIALSVEQGYKAYELPLTLNGKSAEEQDKDLGTHVNSLRKAARQHTPPVTVMVQAGDVNRKTGAVTVTLKTREKIAKSNGKAS